MVALGMHSVLTWNCFVFVYDVLRVSLQILTITDMHIKVQNLFHTFLYYILDEIVENFNFGRCKV